ncbi:MAG TPA: ABC transporter ATP-binding protein [Candidatus Cybelea sp.]|nr:ABC transporter ATP-binding protein [Candidatus Cybelea sp.]
MAVEATTLTGADAETTAAAAPAVGAASGIDFEGVSVAYKGTVVLSDLTLAINPGEIVAVIGPSGSGKTTALRAVAGFVRPSAGRVKIGGRDITDLPPYARDIGMVVQNYALFPHMRVDENVAFGLRARRTADALVKERVAECLRMVGMQSYTKRYPRELSGGQQQRVAIARALAIHPRVLLLDEPLSALDAQIRRNMLDELARLHRALPHLTVLYVTHDQTEALTLADRIAIMRDGKLVSYGPSQALYRRPPNRFTAEFLGRANLLTVTVEGRALGSYARARYGETELLVQEHPSLGAGSKCLLCIRPHEVLLSPPQGPCNTLRGIVQSTVWQGDQHHIALDAAGTTLRLISAPMHEPPRAGTVLDVHFHASHGVLIPHDEA